VDLREKIVAAHIREKISIRKVAIRFSVSKSLVQKLIKQQQTDGNLEPKQRGKPRFSYLTNADLEITEVVLDNPDATIVELCELFALKTGNWVSSTAMCRALKKLELNRKKKHYGVAKQEHKESKISEQNIGKK
jgi:transposase